MNDSCSKNEKCNTFCPLCFGVSLGIVWGLALLLLGWASIGGWGNDVVAVHSSLYIGYDSSILGGIIGGIWGFIYAFVGGAAFAFIYNKLAKKHC